MSVRKIIFPGIVFGILMVIGVASILGGTHAVAAAVSGEMSLEPSAQIDMEGEITSDSKEICSISSLYPDSIRQWCGLIETYAQANNLDPNLISAVMLQESAGQPDAYSKSGAVGLMQVMPSDGKASSFMCKNGPCFSSRPSMSELFDPEYNIAYGANMLAGLVNQHGNVRDALKAYGPMDVGYYYADLVLSIHNSYQ